MSVQNQFSPKLCLLYALITILMSARKPVLASHCEIVEHSELVHIQDKTFYARINQCVLKPSYIIKSEIVTSPDEPQFRNEGSACCCLVDGHVKNVSPDGRVNLRFKQVTECTCGACS